MSVDFPSSTLPHVLKRRISTELGDGAVRGAMDALAETEVGDAITVKRELGSKIAGLLAVFHRRFRGFVVRARAAFGHAGGGDFRDDVVEVIGR